MKNPIDVVCPKCHAAASAECGDKKAAAGLIQWFDVPGRFHKERIELANTTNESIETRDIQKSNYP